jgi:hypothetical protein
VDANLRSNPVLVRDALAEAARLVGAGVTAFLDGDAFRGRRVQQACRDLNASLEQWHDDAVAAWPRDRDTFVNERALSAQVEVLTKAAQQLGGLAESRWATTARDQLREHAIQMAASLQELLAPLADPTQPPASANALTNLRSQRRAFMAWAGGLGQENPRLQSSCLLAVAAAQRIDEAAEAAVAAANLVALELVV